MTCQQCQSPFDQKVTGRKPQYCGTKCRMAAMRARKRADGLIPRAPWTEEGRRAYYGRNARPSPNAAEPISYASYMQRYHPDEWREREERRRQLRVT